MSFRPEIITAQAFVEYIRHHGARVNPQSVADVFSTVTVFQKTRALALLVNALVEHLQVGYTREYDALVGGAVAVLDQHIADSIASSRRGAAFDHFEDAIRLAERELAYRTGTALVGSGRPLKATPSSLRHHIARASREDVVA
ncbi:hypothetical protein [Arthrobacter sp. H5]|uniref:hypothetical protein n=1 Tax=Arthrobacter sp. H5 TaxID=1267973 RepID=UPI00048A0D72|nr:hypothetical protein [Arthrobacter sp. H5]